LLLHRRPFFVAFITPRATITLPVATTRAILNKAAAPVIDGLFLCAGGKLAGMKRRPDKLDLITGFTVAEIVSIVAAVAGIFVDPAHGIMLCIGVGVLFFGLATFANWLTRQG